MVALVGGMMVCVAGMVVIFNAKIAEANVNVGAIMVLGGMIAAFIGDQLMPR